MTQLLGRTRYERRSGVDNTQGSRNGHGKPRRVSLMSGTVEVRRPRVRGLEERFESRILPLLMRRTHAVTELLPELYLHGLSQGTSSWHCGVCWATARRCRPRPSLACGPSGRKSLRPGKSADWTSVSWSTPERMASTSRLGWRKTRRRCWSCSVP